MSMAASKRGVMDMRERRNTFIRKWQPAFMEGADDFARELETLLAHQRREMIESGYIGDKDGMDS